MFQPLHLRRKEKKKRKFCSRILSFTFQDFSGATQELRLIQTWCKSAPVQHQINGLNCSSLVWTVLKSLGESEHEGM